MKATLCNYVGIQTGPINELADLHCVPPSLYKWMNEICTKQECEEMPSCHSTSSWLIYYLISILLPDPIIP